MPVAAILEGRVVLCLEPIDDLPARHPGISQDEDGRHPGVAEIKGVADAS